VNLVGVIIRKTRSYFTWQFILERTHTMNRVGKLRKTGERKDGLKEVLRKLAVGNCSGVDEDKTYCLGTQNFSTQHDA
jgi:hypothetical protein